MKLLEGRTPVKPPASLAEERFRSAQARLLAAQQEKAEAANEFLAARAALRPEGARGSRPVRRTEAGGVSHGLSAESVH